MLLNCHIRLLCAITLTTGWLASASSLNFKAFNETRNESQSGPENVGYFPSTYYMNRFCDRKLYHWGRNSIIVSPWEDEYPPSTRTCKMGVEQKHRKDRFVITFYKMELYAPSAGRCIKSRLDMFNGQSLETYDRINGDRGLCGSNTAQTSYKTTTSFLTLRYETRDLPSKDRQTFQAVITPFHYGPCRDDEFMCLNGHCIYNDMRCDAYNNCGDDSDENNCSSDSGSLSVGAIVGIVVGCVAFVIIVFVLIICCCCCGLCTAYESI